MQLEEENIAFPPGEHYYQLIKDTNKSNLVNKNDNLSERVQLFFTLTEVCNPNDLHSFGITIINNKNIGTKTFLGFFDFWKRKTQDVVVGNCWVVNIGKKRGWYLACLSKY